MPQLSAPIVHGLATLGLVLSLSGTAFAANANSGPGVQWVAAAADAEVDQAFAQARAEKKPVLVYWGAKWCPPCNQLKATLFNRQDFIERSRSFVAVNVDGDLPGAQKLGSRFKVRGYPTMILFSPEGAELTRLPGEADAPQVMQVLQMGLAGGRPVKTVLADAQAGKPLSSNEWRTLGFYSWDTDEAQLVSESERPGLLAQLASKCPAQEGDVATRLMLKALAGSDEGKGVKADAALRTKALKWIADPAVARANMDVLANFAPEITKALSPSEGAERQAVVRALDQALVKLQADASLSRADRLTALGARVDLARIHLPKDARQPKLSPSLLKEVKDAAAKEDREITDGYERQAVVTGAAYVLAQAGLWAESDALLKSNLAKSHSPYYLMSQLASNARKLGQNTESLKWYEEAFNKSEGPATRLQWGASYLMALVELAPQDTARIERAASAMFNEASAQPNAFYERSARSLQRLGSKLKAWNKGGEQAAAMQRLQTQLDGVCAKLPAQDAQRSTCEKLLKSA